MSDKDYSKMRHNTMMYRSCLKEGMRFIILTVFTFMLIVLSVSAATAYAQNASPSTENSAAENNVPGQNFAEDDFKPQIEEESAAWLIIKTILVLALFVGGFYYFYKFVTQKSGMNLSGQEAIQILSTVSLGANKFIQIVDVAGKLFLLGVTDSSINLLTEIKDKDEIDRIRLLSSRSTPVHGATFQDFITGQVGWVADKISDIRSRGSKKQNRKDISSKEFDMSYMNKQKNRLKSMNGDDE